MSSNPPSGLHERFWNGTAQAVPQDLIPQLAAVPAMLSLPERLILYTLVRGFAPAVAVEIGTMWGGSAAIIAMALRQVGMGHVWCVDPNPQLRIDWQTIANEATLVRAPSPQALTDVARQAAAPIEFAFIDGIHTTQAVIADTEGLLPYLAGSAMLVYHDAAHHEVQEGIEHCLLEHPDLKDGGYLSRFFNRDLWPVGLFGGMRLLHFHDARRSTWKPPRPVGRTPGDDRELPRTTLAAARRELQRLVDEGATPIALYGSGRHLPLLGDVLADFSDSIGVIIDDDPLKHGHKRMGWRIVSRAEACALGIKGVFPAVMNPAVLAKPLSELAERGLVVAHLEPPSWEEALPAEARGALEHVLRQLYYFEAVRRFAFYGAGGFCRAALPRLAETMPYIDVVAIADDDPRRQGRRLFGVPICSPSALTASQVQGIVVTSPRFHGEIARKAGEAFAVGLRVVDPFANADTPRT